MLTVSFIAQLLCRKTHCCHPIKCLQLQIVFYLRISIKFKSLTKRLKSAWDDDGDDFDSDDDADDEGLGNFKI